MCCGRRSFPVCWRSSVCIRRWEAVGSQEWFQGWKGRSMLFKPDDDGTKVAGKQVARARSGARRRIVSIAITLLILGGLGYIGWTAIQQKQATKGGGRPD